MTKIKKEIQDIIWSWGYFIDDKKLYTYWLLSKEWLLPEKNYFWIKEIFPWSFAYWKESFKDLYNVTDFDNRFHVGVYSDCKETEKLPKTLKEISWCETKDKSKVLQIMKNIVSDKLTGKDLFFINTLLNFEIFQNLYLMPKTDFIQKDESIDNELVKYIDAFINWELLIEDKNYFNFQKQKELFIKLIREMKAFEEFWKNFIVTNGEVSNPFWHKENTLFLHTIYALEYLWYIRVLKVWFDGHDTPIKYKVNIIPNESFKDLIYQDFRKDNPKSIIEWYDEKKWILSFAWKKITISKSGKETDSKLLLGTLMKAEWENYMHNDEILEDWWYNDEDQKNIPKNKVYFAGQAVNRAMQVQSSIEDLLDITTTKARINPKYRKIL